MDVFRFLPGIWGLRFGICAWDLGLDVMGFVPRIWVWCLGICTWDLGLTFWDLYLGFRVDVLYQGLGVDASRYIF